MIQGAIFDLDGTLVDSMRIWDNILTDYLDARGLTWEPEILQDIAAMGLMESAAYVQKKYALPYAPEEIVAQWEAMVFRLYAEEVEPKPGAVACVKALREAGIPCCIATSNFRKSTLAALRHIGLEDAFSRIFTADEVGGNKSQPDIYLAAARHMNVQPPQCLVAEDMPEAVHTAKNAGFMVCAVYDEISSHGVEQDLQHTADFFVKDLTEVLRQPSVMGKE